MGKNKIMVGKREKLKLSKALYALSAIEEAAAEFEGISTICVSDKGLDYMIIITPKNDKMEKLGHEFCNYVLGLMKEKG
jgi:hypothetical protein